MKKKKISFPSALTVLFIVLIFAAILTAIVPAGLYSKLTYNADHDVFEITTPDGDVTEMAPTQETLDELGVTGMTVTQVMGCGIQKGSGEKYRGAEVDATLLPKVKVEVIGGNIPVEKVIETAKKCLYTGHIGDGKIFVYDVRHVVKVRTGEEDLAALKDVE